MSFHFPKMHIYVDTHAKNLPIPSEFKIKVEFVFLVVDVSILPNADFGPNDHREDAPHFRWRILGIFTD